MKAIDFDPTETWKSIKSQKGFFTDQRHQRAIGIMPVRNREILDHNEPGWYDKWEKAAPLSKSADARRYAIAYGLVPRVIHIFHHPDEHSMTLHVSATGKSLEVWLSGTDEEMRKTVKAALKILLPMR